MLSTETRARMLEDVHAGLSLPQKELPPTYFYDERGSRLFDEITRQPEYYLTGAERELLTDRAGAIVRQTKAASLAELGAGAAGKSRILLEALLRERGSALYVPIDVSGGMLAETARALEAEYDGLRVLPVTADFRSEVQLPADLPRPLLYAFLGSTIGNFTPVEATALLGRLCAAMEPADRLLLGVDLVKDPAILEAAYNDEGRITAAFNVNVLHVLNNALGSDFDPGSFRHQAYYNAQLRRIEMHLVSLNRQAVHIPGAAGFTFEQGETIRTEISCKYDRSAVEALFTHAGLTLERWMSDRREWFALALGVRAR